MYLFVCNIPDHYTLNDLTILFIKFGTIDRIKIAETSGFPDGRVAVVDMPVTEEALMAKKKLNGISIDNLILKVFSRI